MLTIKGLKYYLNDEVRVAGYEVTNTSNNTNVKIYFIGENPLLTGSMLITFTYYQDLADNSA